MLRVNGVLKHACVVLFHSEGKGRNAVSIFVILTGILVLLFLSGLLLLMLLIAFTTAGNAGFLY